MKPLKITLNAFGPYRNKETIDFSELGAHQLFVVSGKTGSGKTTIFDAISFALFGDASGEDRNDARMLRSDFADDDNHTFVEFTFQLKGRVYRVFRQLAHVKEGNKSATGDRYELYEVKNDHEEPLTDRFIVSQVNDRIQELIGLTKDQFNQIIMLPQGEFRKLLTSETENKEEILRRIFKTTFYKKVAERLNDKRRETQKLFDEQVKEREIYMENIKASLPEREEGTLTNVFQQEHYNTHQVLTALDEERLYYQGQYEMKQGAFQEKLKQQEKQTEAFHRAQNVNAQFLELERKKQVQSQLAEKKEEMEQKEKQHQLAEKAAQLEVYEKQYKELKQDLESKQQELKVAKANKEEADLKVKRASELYKEEEAKADQREKTGHELERLKGFLPVVEELDQKKQMLQKLSVNVKEKQEKVKLLEETISNKKNVKKTMNEKISPLEEKVKGLPDKTEKIAVMRERAKVLGEYIAIYNSVNKTQKELATELAHFRKVETEFTHLEQKWVEGQASVLANHLHDGKPCPVCGSIEHPNKAILTKDIPTKEEVEQKRKEKQQLEVELSKKQGSHETDEKRLHEKQQEVVNYGYELKNSKQEYDLLVEKGKALGQEITNIKQAQEELEKLKKQQEELEKELELKVTEHQNLYTKLNEENTSLQTEKSLYMQSIAKIPEELQKLTQLKEKIQQLEATKNLLDKNWKAAQEKLQTTKEAFATAKANQENAEKRLQEAENRSNKAKNSYEEAITKAGFESEASYLQAKLEEASRKRLKQEIEDYYNQLKSLKAQIEQLEEQLKDNQKADLEQLQAALKQLNEEVEEARSTLNRIQTYMEKVQEAKQKIADANNKVKDVENKLQLIKDLYDVVRGENTRKISFERYLQIEFLEQIIQSANERLTRLSNGQYILVRSDRLEKRGRQSGLGLDVYDNYTGQLRDVKTLSGGEKFNASLCLALGMADVIQAYEGGISIETMFIDEGFGSLDEESLNKAIDTLIDLQKSGRMIGVISHVQELKQAIPAILEVEKTKEGYSRTRFVVK